MKLPSSTPEQDALIAKGYRIINGKATKDFSNAAKSLHELQKPVKNQRAALKATPKTSDAPQAVSTAWQEVTFVVPGEPIPKGRPRVMGKVTFTPKRTVAYERKVKVAALAAMVNKERFEFSVKVRIHFIRKTRRACDIDNLMKAILDSCNGIVYDDDSQIVDAHITKAFGYSGEAQITFQGKTLSHD